MGADNVRALFVFVGGDDGSIATRRGGNARDLRNDRGYRVAIRFDVADGRTVVVLAPGEARPAPT
jgi:hypothetical protein